MFKFVTKKRILLTGLLLVGIWLGLSAWVAWNLTQRARRPFAEPAPLVDWAEFEDVRLSTADGEQIGGWLARGTTQRGCVLLLHGNGGSRKSMLPEMRLLVEEGFSILAVSLRAHGDSTGEVNDFGYSARADVLAAVTKLRAEFPHRPVFILGRSLGAAAALFAAEEIGEDISGLFLESPYRDLSSATWNRLSHYLPPVADRVAYAGLRLWSPLFLPVDPDRIAPCRAAADVPQSVPVVIVAGSDDERATLDDARSVFEPLASHGKLVVFQGAKHNGCRTCDPELYLRTLLDLVARHRVQDAANGKEVPKQQRKER